MNFVRSFTLVCLFSYFVEFLESFTGIQSLRILLLLWPSKLFDSHNCEVYHYPNCSQVLLKLVIPLGHYIFVKFWKKLMPYTHRNTHITGIHSDLNKNMSIFFCHKNMSNKNFTLSSWVLFSCLMKFSNMNRLWNASQESKEKLLSSCFLSNFPLLLIFVFPATAVSFLGGRRSFVRFLLFSSSRLLCFLRIISFFG